MADFILREYENTDIPALISLWNRTFGDSERLLGEFFRLLPDMGSGVVAVRHGQVIGAAYALTGMELANVGNDAPVCGYIYAVAVEEAHRRLGAGRALTVAAAELAKKRGARVICTLPAEASLYGWYKNILGVDCALWRKKRRISSAAIDPCLRLSAAEYGQRREAILQDKPHLRLSTPSLEFQRLLCEEYGGGFFACGSGIAAAYADGSRGILRELLCVDEKETDKVAASVGAALGTDEALLCDPAGPDEGEPYIAALPGFVPADCIWNLSMD